MILKRNFQAKFVEKEINKIQERFNQTFGRQKVCDIRRRQTVLLSICWLCILGRRIIETKDRNPATHIIQKFVRARNVLNNFFREYEKQLKARRDNDYPMPKLQGRIR